MNQLAYLLYSGHGLVGILINLIIIGAIIGLVWYYLVPLLPAPFQVVCQVILVIICILFLASLLTSCQTTATNTTPNAITRTGQDLKQVAVTALQDYAQAKSGGINSLWSISKGLYAYSTIVQTNADIKAVIADWKSTKGDTLLNRIERVLNMSDATPEVKALVIASAAQQVAANH